MNPAPTARVLVECGAPVTRLPSLGLRTSANAFYRLTKGPNDETGTYRTVLHAGLWAVLVGLLLGWLGALSLWSSVAAFGLLLTVDRFGTWLLAVGLGGLLLWFGTGTSLAAMLEHAGALVLHGRDRRRGWVCGAWLRRSGDAQGRAAAVPYPDRAGGSRGDSSVDVPAVHNRREGRSWLVTLSASPQWHYSPSPPYSAGESPLWKQKRARRGWASRPAPPRQVADDSHPPPPTPGEIPGQCSIVDALTANQDQEEPDG